MTLRVAIVGCGRISDGHVEQIRELGDRATVIAVCDRERVMADQLASRYGILGVYDDLAAMLAKARPDVVHIATPPDSHLAIARQAVEAGAHVFCEKPLTLTYDDSKELVSIFEAEGRKLTIGYNYHFDPPAIELRSLIDQGVLGDVVHVDTHYGYDFDGAFGRSLFTDGSHWVHGLPGKLLHNVLDHPLSKVVEYLDDDRPDVVARGSIRRTARFGDPRDELVDELRVMVRGHRATAYVTFSAHARPIAHWIRVHGTRNTAYADFNARTVTLDRSPTLPSALGRLFPAFESAIDFLAAGGRNVRRFGRSEFHYFAGFGELLSRFYRAIETDGPVPIPTQNMLRIARMMDDILEQVPQRGHASAIHAAHHRGEAT